MIHVREAEQLIQKYQRSLGTRRAQLGGEGILTEDLRADRDYPPFHRVMMDGIAVGHAAYQEGQRTFRLAGVCAAGAPAGRLTDPSTALEVMTGAPLPDGADLIIQYEHLKIENGLAVVAIEAARAARENIHEMGSDAKRGDVLLRKGQSLNGAHWGIAASLGYAQPNVERSPRIAVISTGDELVAVDATPEAHQIRRSNAYALEASLRQHGHRDITLFHLRDTVEAIEAHYREHAEVFDLMIYSGGVSKGKFDYLPNCWKSMGVKEVFHGIAQRPGKPLWFGVDEARETTVFGLPGNPVSSLVCLHRYIIHQKSWRAQLSQEITFKKDMTFFVPAKLETTAEGILRAVPLPLQNSGEFAALAESDGFLELPAEESVFRAGQAYDFHLWRKL